MGGTRHRLRKTAAPKSATPITHRMGTSQLPNLSASAPMPTPVKITLAYENMALRPIAVPAYRFVAMFVSMDPVRVCGP